MIQAGSVAIDGTAAGGNVSLTAGGNITNDSSSANLGIIFSANGATDLSAQGGITNDNARILANGAVTLTALGGVQNVIDHTSGTNGGAPWGLNKVCANSYHKRAGYINRKDYAVSAQFN